MEDLSIFYETDFSTSQRDLCPRCGLHVNICACHIVKEQYNNSIQIVILQDPREAKTKVNTVKLITNLFQNVQIYKRNLPETLNRKIAANKENYAVLYPSKVAKPIDSGDDITFTKKYTTIIIVDGTWEQAKSVYNRNAILSQIDNLILVNGEKYCRYKTVRKEIDGGMSTFEATATTLSLILNDPFLITERDRIMDEFITMRTRFFK
ncbi:hypothetical protein EIN_381580 [Entamoeba invadens IP1]|uniref:tRNA-uridine aminocarboxypropyltransferase n=1 Tax=Entamoeba invadens IP1 TaxID=370355 RepID=A0A0A1UEH0_ENTIV|nr:hypothetical protein EIN_381580 [Entamoeba invadens IP1]ELP92191.1 hypothetical protein EIN_381580 [Entamoeba invadens IP1]|eukprot:XP_004258962.1 hypothetical protein EIN_381580 [Entamoeba invadens IP1]